MGWFRRAYGKSVTDFMANKAYKTTRCPYCGGRGILIQQGGWLSLHKYQCKKCGYVYEKM